MNQNLVDDFHIKVSWEDILTPHGWTPIGSSPKTGADYWSKKRGDEKPRASTNWKDRDVFYAYADNLGVIPRKAYTKFGLYTHLNHSGDSAAAEAALIQQGYGTSFPKEEPSKPKKIKANHRLTAHLDWEDILAPHGWTWDNHDHTTGTDYWLRPGKTWEDKAEGERGDAATRGEWSPHFVPAATIGAFVQGTSYTKFAAYAILAHNGDYKAAGTQLRADIKKAAEARMARAEQRGLPIPRATRKTAEKARRRPRGKELTVDEAIERILRDLARHGGEARQSDIVKSFKAVPRATLDRAFAAIEAQGEAAKTRVPLSGPGRPGWRWNLAKPA